MSAVVERSFPVPSPSSQPYWDAAREGRLALPRCTSCDRLVYPPLPDCPDCDGGELRYEDLSGRGRVHAVTTVRSPILPGLEPALPLQCALVELVEQDDLLVVTNLVGSGDAPPLGTDVVVVFDTTQPVPLPMFRVADAPGS
jgi:uncharacterized OB-fold protein